MPQLDILASVSYAAVDKKPVGFVGGSYGWEVDITGTYKITNNLTYMLGLGYLFTGDYFKGYDEGGDYTGGYGEQYPTHHVANDLANNYLIINKLTLSF